LRPISRRDGKGLTFKKVHRLALNLEAAAKGSKDISSAANRADLN